MTIKVKSFNIFRKHHHKSSKDDKDKKQKENKQDQAPVCVSGGGFMRRIGTALTLGSTDSFHEEDCLSASVTDIWNLDDSLEDHQKASSWFNVLHLPSKQSEPVVQNVEIAHSFADEFEQLVETYENKKNQSIALTLTNFIEQATRHEIYALRDLLANEHLTIEHLTLVDATTGADMRRWRYKKDNISHHIRNLCANRKIALSFQEDVCVDIDHMTPTNARGPPSNKTQAVLNALSEIEKDNELTNLEITGHLETSQAAEQVFKGLLSLIGARDRNWESIKIVTALEHSPSTTPMEFQHWMQSLQFYRQIFAQLSSEYGIPITIEPLR